MVPLGGTGHRPVDNGTLEPAPWNTLWPPVCFPYCNELCCSCSAGNLGHMTVTERMQALGDHAKSSRQPPLRPRQTAGGDLAAGSHFIHDDNPLTSPIDDDEVKALLHQSIEDCAAEEHIIPENAAIAAIADVSAPQLFPSETNTAAR